MLLKSILISTKLFLYDALIFNYVDLTLNSIIIFYVKIPPIFSKKTFRKKYRRPTWNLR